MCWGAYTIFHSFTHIHQHAFLLFSERLDQTELDSKEDNPQEPPVDPQEPAVGLHSPKSQGSQHYIIL
jgi:hypothetical protein